MLFDAATLFAGGNSAGAESSNQPGAARLAKFEDFHSEAIVSLKSLLGKTPSQGEVCFLWTLKSFNAFTFIAYICKHIGAISELVFTTYSINERILAALRRRYDEGLIESIHILISDSIRSRMPKVNDQMVAFASDRNVKISYAWNHSKIILMRTAGHFFVVCGSGNFSENALYEQYIFLDDERIYTFYLHNIENCAR